MTAIMETGQIVKMEVDYSDACDEKIPKAEALAKQGKMQDALDSLLALEKQTRTGMDTHSTSRVLVAIVQICFNARAWDGLNEQVLNLTKRRSQIKQSVAKMVQECCTFVDKIEDETEKLRFIDTLRTVTEGKIYVEVERARLTLKLALMKEAEGKVKEAAEILQELQVETFGSMEKKEKVEMILEQMRLCLIRKDLVRCQIIAKKVSTRFFEDEAMQSLKLRYYKLMIELDRQKNAYLMTSKHYRCIYDTPCVQSDPEARDDALKQVVLYLLLAPHDNEQHDLLHRIKNEKNLQNKDVKLFNSLLSLFTTSELIHWATLVESYETALRDESPSLDVFARNETGDARWKDFKTRVVEHNIRVMAKYYTRITLQRMAELLSLSPEEAEEFLANLVVNGTVEAKTDRPTGIVSFTSNKSPEGTLQEWSSNLNMLMKLVNKTTHLINKEEMVHKHLLAAKN
ncbi:unnamed protein product [Cyprideis torosa]|uniref:Uncharacterized protein n=1 Tax=Cyprideis torosa TaxID=163714 RepID=A0A7R8WCS1_9CRUS|nr:unnamed protein product [Cyprideis torosa]CAG0893715.1 unnamed protein product [Cyprideis torosa]